MIALDLFCGAGGASMGLHRAGFDVIGVDIARQPRYPFKFVQADALRPPFDLREFDFIWASPVCKKFTIAGAYQRSLGTEYPNQIPETRALLATSGRLTCIENVPQAPIRPDLILDGTMFPDLKVIRRRHFELNFRPPLRLGFDATGYITHKKGWCTVVGRGVPSKLWRKGVRPNVDTRRAAMGIDWMDRDRLSQAIPPAYAEFIGRAALAHLDTARAAGIAS